jgi:hypothetical protein
MIEEIWRKQMWPGCPIRFTRGQSPAFINEAGNMATVPESPPIKSINFYETGAFSKHWGPCFVIQFEDSNVRRIIPAAEVKDICWAVPEKETAVETPALES